MITYEFQHLNEESRDNWNANADYWDQRMGEGNDFHLELLEPAQLPLLDLQPDELVLDIACGNGQFARKMAQLGARVVATDISERMIGNAKARTGENADRIEYRVVDATSREQLLALGEGRFDAAVCTMAIMDMASIDPLFESLSRLLKAGGRFVFSICHPCFNANPRMQMLAEREEIGDELVTTYAVKVSRYITPVPHKGIAIVGQPVAQTYFHRPISAIFNAGFKAGFIIDGIEELAFQGLRDDRKGPSWDNFTEIPPMLAARMRPVSS